jgi:hypothetical protein
MGRMDVEGRLAAIKLMLEGAIGRGSTADAISAGKLLTETLNSPEFQQHQAEMSQLVGSITRQIDELDPETKRLITSHKV